MPTTSKRLLVAVVGVGLVAAMLAACNPGPTGPGTTTTVAPSAATCAQPGLPTTAAYRTIPGVAANAVSLDIYAPVRACVAPVVLWVHGGGYQRGDKANQVRDKVALFNAKGWLFVSINYRLTVPGSPTSAQFPDHYEDVAAAVAWVRDRIKSYGGDPNRLALLGHSAGADIVANVANKPSYLAAEGLPTSALDCIGPLDTEGFDKVTSVGDDESVMWRNALGNDPDYLTKTSATRFIQASDDVPATIGVYRGTPGRQAIEKAYLTKVATTGARTVAIDAVGLSHADINTRIGAAGDQVITPPLIAFLTDCFRIGDRPTTR